MSQDQLAVYQYLWRDHHLPAFKQLVLTLTGTQALVMFAFVSTFIAYSQTRLWILVQKILFRILRPIQLPDAEDTASLHHLTQAQAIYSLVSRKHRLIDGSMRKFRPVSTIVPNYLSGGSGTPTVQSESRLSETHDYRDPYFHQAVHSADIFFKQCWVNRLHGSDLKPLCDQRLRIIGNRPKLSVTRLNSCPFKGPSCAIGTGSVQVEHTGLSLLDFGVNIDPNITFNHRLTCASLYVEKFLCPSADNKRSTLWFGDPMANTGGPVWGTNLSSLNGPNKYSGEYSGSSRFYHGTEGYMGGSQFFTIAGPAYVGEYEGIHQNLSRNDGDVFILIYKARQVTYVANEPLDDPLYAAHRDAMNSTGGLHAIGGNMTGMKFWVPDFEATALGCVEQFQHCFGRETSSCEKWVTKSGYRSRLYRLVSREEREVYLSTIGHVSVLNYLGISRGVQALLASIYSYYDQAVFRYIHPTEQWVEEVKGWFETAFLRVRFTLLTSLDTESPQRVVKRRLGTVHPYEPEIIKPYYRVLFLSDDYVNINFLGLVSTLTGLSCLCALSYASKIAKLSHKLAAVAKSASKRLLQSVPWKPDISSTLRYVLKIWKGNHNYYLATKNLFANTSTFIWTRNLWQRGQNFLFNFTQVSRRGTTQQDDATVSSARPDVGLHDLRRTP